MGRDGDKALAELFDLIQSRYGWADEIIHGLLFARFMQLVRLSIDALNEEGKERLVLASYIGWQMGAGGKLTFGAYLNKMGLSGEAPQSKAPVVDKAGHDARLRRMGIEIKRVGVNERI